MKNITTLRAIALALLILPALLAFAQGSDSFFFNDFDLYENRFVTTIGSLNDGIQNDDFVPTPLGSGLLILTAAGAGYAISRRRRNNKKGITLMLAALMLLGITSCKKNIVEPIAPATGNQVAITLNVGGGAKVIVNENHVNFENGDKILVASNGHYVGTLTHNGSNFSGNITDPTEGQPLYFYFLGNKQGWLSVGASGCTVNISDQTDYPHLPIISMGASFDNYQTGTTEYAAQLHNKCSLMKFNVTTPSAEAIYLTGMNNTVTVNFADLSTNDGFSYSCAGKTWLKGKDSNGVTWAIVLPQADLSDAGAAYTVGYSGTWDTDAVDLTAANQYIAGDGSGITLAVNTVDNSRTVNLATIDSDQVVADGWSITGTLTSSHKISIANGATVTLNGVEINRDDLLSGSFAGITCEGNATIVLADGTVNWVKALSSAYLYYAGIYIPNGSTLTIKGTGTLHASGHSGSSGIGANYLSNCGNIFIKSGNIVATGGTAAAGIGSSVSHSCGNIEIQGGTVYATGGSGGAGIGTGSGMESEPIPPSPHNNRNDFFPSSCGTITISGGTVTAYGGEKGAGIGTGSIGNCGNITITSGAMSVAAIRGSSASHYIGTGYNGSDFSQNPYTVTIDGQVMSLSLLSDPLEGNAIFTNYISNVSSNIWMLTHK